MNVEILIVGLALFCVNAPGDEGGDCKVPGDETLPGRVYFVNATKDKCGDDCGNSDKCCEACELDDGYRYENILSHQPMLKFEPTQVKESRITKCKDHQGNDIEDCWDLVGKALCLEEPPMNGTLETEGGAGNGEQPNNLFGWDRDAFGWVASIKRFDPLGACTTAADCFLQPDRLKPATDGAVVASLNLAEVGKLESARLGRRHNNNFNFTLWYPKGMSLPVGRTLAEAVVWGMELDTFTLKECDGEEHLTFKTEAGDPRVILLNLPPGGINEPCPDVGADTLDHYALYYNLFKGQHRGSCTVPEGRPSGSSYLVAFELDHWIRSGNFKEPTCREDGQPLGGPEKTMLVTANADTALCPPSKFP